MGIRADSGALLTWMSTLCVSLLCFAPETHAGDPGAVAKGSAPAPIRLGMSTALSGPAADLGRNVRQGVLAALAEANRSAGVGGRLLELVALDDGYEPSRTAPTMRRLIDEEQVLAVIGNVGTPTAIAAVPIANSTGTPFFGAFTGASMLRRTPPDRYVFNFRASYAEETAAMVEALVKQRGLALEEIAFFTQRDAYGDAVFASGVAALRRFGLSDPDQIRHGRYERNTEAVESGLAEILSSDKLPRAVIMVGAYAPCAAFIRLAREYEFDALFLNVSFVGSVSLARELGALGDGVVVTQVVPHPDADLPVVREYRSALDEHNPWATPSFGSLEGYIATRVFLRALGTISGPITRESVVQALEAMGRFQIGLDGPLEFGPSEHQASHRVWPTALRAGHIVPIEWAEIAGPPAAHP